MRRTKATIAFVAFGIYLTAVLWGTVSAWLDGKYEQGFSHERPEAWR